MRPARPCVNRPTRVSTASWHGWASPTVRTPPRTAPGPRPAASAVEDVDRIEEELAATRAALARVERRVNLVTWVVTLEGIAVAILAVLLLLR